MQSTGENVKSSKGFNKQAIDENKKILVKPESAPKNHIPSIIITRGKTESRSIKSRKKDDFPSRPRPMYHEERRGSYRGRGISVGRKDEYISRGRFSESISKKADLSGKYSNDTGTLYRSDFPGLPEDSRISSTLRRLSREEDEKKFEILTKNLQEALALPDNANYIRRSLDMILDSLFDLMTNGVTTKCREMASQSLGHLGYALNTDFKKFLDWIFNKYASANNDDNRRLIMNSVLELTNLDKENPKLQEFAQLLMTEVREVMENTDVGEIFVVTAEITVTLTQRYPDTFTAYFHDTIDIILGWHIDTNQDSRTTRCAANCLRRLAPYWYREMTFTIDLLRQFIEDGENYRDELLNPSEDSQPSDVFKKITSFIEVFTSVFRGLGSEMSPQRNPHVTWAFLCESLSKIMDLVLSTLPVALDNNLVIAGNKCASLIMSFLEVEAIAVDHLILNYIYAQIELSKEMTVAAVASLFTFIVKVAEIMGSKLTEEFVDTLLGPNSLLLKMRFKNVQEEVNKVYYALLQHLDVGMALRAYSHVVGDLDVALRTLNDSVEPLIPFEENFHSATMYPPNHVEAVILNTLKVFTDLVLTDNSILSMYVLKPGLFEILAGRLPSVISPVSFPKIHYTYIYLLRVYCVKNNYFLAASGFLNRSGDRLLLGDVLALDTPEGNVPAPSNITILTIINILIENLEEPMDPKNKDLILVWAVDILILVRPYKSILLCTEEVKNLVKAVCVAATDCRPAVSLQAATRISDLIRFYNCLWPEELMKGFLDLCLYFLNSTDCNVRAKYHDILLHLPCLIIVFSMNYCASSKTSKINQVLLRQYEEISRGYLGELTSFHFKQFMSYLLEGENEENIQWMSEILTRCWPVLEVGYDKGCEAMHNLAIITEWIAFQSAYLCVDNKMRTPLGKPIGTFTAIESVIRDLAKESQNRKCGKNSASGRRARILIQFVEQLEKCVYNATEGTASAFPPVNKAVKTFFHTNRGPCYEWFTRTRLALLVVCLNCGMASSAVRHGYAFLQAMLDLGNTQTSEFESALLNIGWALANMGEKEAVQGLYMWARDTANVKHPLLKPLVEMAGRRYESAAESFMQIVKDIETSPGEKQNEEIDKTKQAPHSVRSFLAEQITESYLSVNNWNDLRIWKKKESEFLDNENGSSSHRFKYITPNFCESMELFEAGETIAAKELLSWDCPKHDSDENQTKWDFSNILSENNFILKNVAIVAAISPNLPDCCLEKLTQVKEGLEKIIETSIKDAPSEILSQAVLLQFITSSLQNKINLFDSPLYDSQKQWKLSFTSPDVEQAACWAYTLDRIYKKTCPSPNLKSFLLQSVKSSRKTGNLHYATVILKKYLYTLGVCSDIFYQEPIELTERVMETLKDQGSKWNIDDARALKQLAKILKSSGEIEKSIELSSFVADGIYGSARLQFRNQSRGRGLMAMSASLLRDIASMIQRIDKEKYAGGFHLNKLLETQISQPADKESNCLSHSILNDYISGRLLRLSLVTEYASSKSWEHLGAWAYSCGLEETASRTLMGNDKALIAECLQESDMTTKLVQDVFKMLTAAYNTHDVEVDTTSSEMIEQQLRSVSNFTTDQLNTLVSIWKGTHSRVYAFFRLSALSYFKYLQLSQFKEDDAVMVRATLRLLRLIVKHASELQDEVESGLSATPTSPWVSIVPQLFSRLNHPEQYVRKRVSELLTRIGIDLPHLIVFPAVVGSHTGASTIKDMPTTKLFTMKKRLFEETDDAFEEYDEDEENEEEDEVINDDDEMKSSNERAAVLENSFTTILDTLSRKYGEEISQVRTLVSELRRITLLWDELWLGTLLQHQADITRRFVQLSAEVRATDSNTHLSEECRDQLVAEKFRLILKPLLFVLEQLHAITSVEPETPHEREFQDKFGKDIDILLMKLKEPANPRQPNEAWQAIKTLQSKLQSRAAKRTSVCLSMGDISPALAKLNSTKISMPGVRSHVSVQSIENNVAVLPTKTKPKKLVFNGSNGQRYIYLFKGLEDLHLDERIMQFLSIANAMLKEPHLRAHHYSVVPLGPRSGLISWVENVTPIFSLYKKWQQRDCHAGSSEDRQIWRPSELFYSKLGPILKESGITSIDPMQRNKWPVSALKKCLVELMQSTPTYLLSKELWCHSVNAADWWRVTKLYSSSLAVMSIIGYIIGLGDRHLDNVLVNLKTGEVVHIDYNVCFEKGKTLRVPEKVPFRLTPNLRAALGVTGIEGIYRITCEHVLKVLKEGHETLLTLLEAFVYDPLIDWTPLNEGGYTGAVYGGGRELASETKQSKRELEKEVTCSMFKVRITEAKHQWLENKKLLLRELEEMLGNIEFWLSEEKKIREIQQSLQERHTQLALLKEAEGQPQHTLYNLGVRCSKHLQVCNAKQATINTLKAKIQEFEQQLSSFKNIVSSMRGSEMSQWVKEVNSRPRQDVCQVFDLIKEFLQNAGQNQTVQQCIQSERDVGELCIQQSQLTLSLLDMLVQYWEISRQYPVSYLKTHRATLYKRWAEMLLEDMSPQKCCQIKTEMSREFAANEELLRQTGMYSAGLQRQLTECRQYLTRIVERGATLSNSVGGGTTTYQPYKLDVSQTDPICLEAVVLNALTALNKRFLMMEAAATSAGDCLLSLTSRDGDWFLEDMVLIGSTVLKLIQLLPSLSKEDVDPNVATAVKCLQHAHAQFKGLQEVHNNFTGIILVEAMQAMQCEEPSVLKVLAQLEVVVSSISPLTLAELSGQLHKHLRFTIMGMQSPHETCMASVDALRIGFQSLLPHGSCTIGEPKTTKSLSQGDMLLMGFNGLFDNVQLGRETLLAHLSSLQSPPAWKIVDQVREAKSHYIAPICEEEPKAILESMFFVKRLSTILEVLRMCRDDAAGFRCAPGSPPVPHDRDSLTKPVRRYIADYISCQLLGVFSLSLAIAVCLLLQHNGFDVTGEVEQKDIGAQGRVPLEELCKKMAERLGRAQQLRQVSGLISQAETVWRQEELLKRVEQDVVNARALLHRIQVAITAHHWLHEHYLLNSPPPPINRAAFMIELRKSMSALYVLQPKIKEALEHQNSLVTSAEQRLKWAAGANPALNEVMSAFEASVTNSRERVEAEVSLALIVANMSNTVLQHEALRTPTAEAVANDNSILRLVDECVKLHKLLKENPVTLTSAEEGLIALIPPKKKIDQEWISKAEELISESVRSLKTDLEPQQIQLLAAEDCVKNKATNIRVAMAKHHRIITDIRTLLKTMVKYEDAGLTGLEKYLARYKKFTDTISNMTKGLGMAKSLTANIIASASEETKILHSVTDDIYGELLKFSVGDSPIKRPQLIRQSIAVCESPKKEPKTKKSRLGVQERNAYAMSVWRRVKFKLEGRDPDPGVRSTEKQQVDWAISEATNLENLSLLYEGWTPWV